jgi:NAD(P)-dependent dehydrogenase (short-subunit alcohol dehydrogenase family)
MMDLSNSTPVVTGANRGLGRHLVDALLQRGTERVYALARKPSAVTRDPRVIAIPFDLLDERSIDTAAARAADATLLINNASTAAIAGALEADLDDVRRELAANFVGLYATIRAFVPVLAANGGGRIVNVLSMLGLASSQYMTGYSASKAAAHSLTQAMRAALAPKGITVHAVYPGGIDTDMVAGVDSPKAPPADVAARILDGLAANREDIFPDPSSQAMSQLWRNDPKALERAFSGTTATETDSPS